MVKISINPKTNLQDTPTTNTGGIAIKRGYSAYAGRKLPESYGYDSMNFTNIYTDDLSKYQKYDVPTTRFFNWDEERAKNQGTGEKWVNGLAKAGVTTLGAVAENTLGVAAGIGELVKGGAYYDNFVGKSVDKFNENMRESFPNYKTQAEEEMSTGQKLLTANFWADTVANGFGYSIGSLATIWLTSGVGVIGRGAKAMQLYNATKAAANGTKIAQTIAAGSKAKGFVNLAAMGEMGLYMSLAEASVEARETQKNTYDDLIAQELEIKGLTDISELSASELKNIENTSYATGNSNFIGNLMILMPTNLFMFGKHVAGFKGASKVNKDIAYDVATGKVLSSVAKQGIYKNAWGRLKPTAGGILTEAAQEGGQFASNIMTSDYHTDKYFDAGTTSLISSFYKGIKETVGTQEGLESILVGGIVGGGMAGITSAVQKPYKQRQKQAELAASVINGGFLKNVNNSMKSHAAQQKVADDMEVARKSKDIKKFKDAQYKLIQYSALAAIESGGFDVFKQKLEDSKSLSDVDFAKMFGYNPEVEIKEQTGGKSKNEVIKNVQDKLDAFKVTYEKVNELFPSAPVSQGLDRMRMSEAERKAEDAQFNKRANLRNELILSASGIENKMERLESIQNQMKTLLTETARLNGIKDIKTGELGGLPDIDLVLSDDLIETEDGKYKAVDEINLISKQFEEIKKELVDKNALAAIAPFNALSEDYMSIFMDKATAIDRYNKLSSSKYFQDLFEEIVKADQAEAAKISKEKIVKEDIDNAETSDQVKESVPEDASNNTKMEAEVKAKDLRKLEQEEVKKYLNLHKDKSIEEQLKRLQHIAATEQELSPTERKGLEIAIKNLESKVKKGQKRTTTRKVEVFDESSAEEITMTEDNIVRAENNDEIAKNAPKKRPVRKKTEAADAKRKSDPTPTAGGELNIVSATNKAEVVQVGTYINEDGVEKPIMKVPVDDDGKVIEPNADKVDGKTIPMVPDLLLANDIIGEEVTFEIVENDWWTSGEFRDERFTEDWMHIPIYYKIGNAYVGKLEGSTNEDRKAIVDKLQGGQIVSTKISDIQTSNFNNTVDETTAPYFHNPEDTFGKEDDILLGFTTVSKVGPNITYQWTLSQVTDDKNKNNELDQINVEVTKEVSANSINQIGIVIKKENNPAGVSRISIASTANLNATAQAAVLQALADKNFEKAKEIVANSDQRLAANSSPRYLEFAAFDNGTKYIVYASPKLGKLIRITEDELKKALDETGPSTFNIVTEVNEAFVGDKSTTEKSKINIKEDLAEFLESKKYHVDRAKGNSKGVYTSPVTNVEYPSYQHYLFASKELGDEVRLEGSGHNSILSTDIVKKGESMFNSPQVKFSKGDLLGETPAEIIKNTKLAENIPEIKEASIEQKREEVLNKVRYLKGRDGFAEERSKPSYISFELDSEGKYKKWFSVETGSPTAKNKAAAKEKLIAQINEYYDAQLAEPSPEAPVASQTSEIESISAYASREEVAGEYGDPYIKEVSLESPKNTQEYVSYRVKENEGGRKYLTNLSKNIPLRLSTWKGAGYAAYVDFINTNNIDEITTDTDLTQDGINVLERLEKNGLVVKTDAKVIKKDKTGKGEIKYIYNKPLYEFTGKSAQQPSEVKENEKFELTRVTNKYGAIEDTIIIKSSGKGIIKLTSPDGKVSYAGIGQTLDQNLKNSIINDLKFKSLIEAPAAKKKKFKRGSKSKGIIDNLGENCK